MFIYHGSKKKIESPITKGSNIYNDYGPAFYLTLDKEMAKVWASRNNEAGYINKYKIEDKKYKSLNILDLTNKNKYSILNWIAILIHFRKLDDNYISKYKERLDYLKKFYIDVNKYDVVIGYRADDAYFRFPLEFINGFLSFEDLNRVYLLGNLGIQYAFISDKAVKSLIYVDSILCEDEYIGQYFDMVKDATYKFDKILNVKQSIKKKYIYDLVKEKYGIK